MIALSDITQAFRNASDSDREEFLTVLIPTFEAKVTKIVESVLNNSFDTRLIGSELLRPIQRISKLECISGLDKDYNIDDEREPTIPERIQTLETKLSKAALITPEKPSVEIIQKTGKGRRAMHLINTLLDSGKKHLSHKEIKEALADETLGDDRVTPEDSNPRRKTIEALNEAKKLCSSVITDKKGFGRHEWRLLLKS